ncbi:MAG: toll/interleukin-1 receptor domain-containing protein, partial [Symploca sp. SIO1C4]|nr:toll/interleukin-1 receptor domain-containing protein [Symploca sp. SIO1C4]
MLSSRLIVNFYPLSFIGLKPLLHVEVATGIPGEPIFISYAHKDEAFKDELVVMVESMQRNGVIDAWQDRRIEPGDDWDPAIQAAMDECDLAILLVSKNFLASHFI